MIYTIYIVPILIIVIGFLMCKYPPKKPNWFVGYRTRSSMKDKIVWEIANRYCGNIWMKLGSIMLVLSFLIHVLVWVKQIMFYEMFLSIIIICQVVLLVLTIVIVEGKIKNINSK